MKNKKGNENIDKKNNIKKSNKGTKILLILALIFVIFGAVILLYPNVSNYFANKNHTELIKTYSEVVNKSNKEELEKEMRKAISYNENLSGEPVHDPFVKGSGYALPKNYLEVLNVTDNDIMGYIKIPKISVFLPIYHGTSKEVLEKGIGHIQTTSLPIGGNSTHCALTGHTGLPNAELFTRIDELDIGDVFYIYTLDKVLEYKVYETKVILPDQISELKITSNDDLVTLVTCTPYGVNSHRLLVKARRIEYDGNDIKNANTLNASKNNNNITDNNKSVYLSDIQIFIFISVVILIVIFILFNLLKRKKDE